MLLRIARTAGASIAYGALAAFLYLVGVQMFRWLRDGEWTHLGTSDVLRLALLRCCVKDGDTGHVVDFVQWVDAPTTWLGLHKVLEIVPASLSLFAVSILGNCIFIYCRDRMPVRTPVAVADAP